MKKKYVLKRHYAMRYSTQKPVRINVDSVKVIEGSAALNTNKAVDVKLALASARKPMIRAAVRITSVNS